jgi:Family of unknown function (DUF6074)
MSSAKALPLFDRDPRPAKVVPFPLVKRRAMIFKAAREMLTRGFEMGARDPAATGEKILAATLQRQRSVMARRGIDPDTIYAELKALELAIRCECTRLKATGIVA